MATLRYDRIIPLRDLTSYPGSGYLDLTIFLPWSDDTTRRLWLLAPASSPTVSIDDVVFEPKSISGEWPRWVDYGSKELPHFVPNWARGEFFQLRVRGMPAAECGASYLVITAQHGLSLAGCSLEEAESKLWGLSRAQAGTTTLLPSRVAAGSAADFTVTYRAGAAGLPMGALIRFTVPKAFSRPQTERPGEPGSVAIVDGAGRVQIACIEDSAESHEKVDIICRLTAALQPGEGFALRYTTERTYIFTGEFHEVDRRYWYTNLPPLAAAVAFTSQSSLVSTAEGNGHVFEVVPGPSERLHLFLPGRRFASDALTLKGTYTDHYRNTPPSGAIDTELELWLERDGDRLALGSPQGRFVARHRFEVALPRLDPGVYRAIACRPGSRAALARSNPLEVMAAGDPRERLYWGDIHGHTEMSDGCGEYSELYRHAQQEGCLDFAAAADHAEYVTDNQWQWMQDVTNAWNQPGRFATLVAYEWEGRERDRTVLSSHPRLPIMRGNYPPTGGLDVVWGRFRGDDQVVGGPHATMVHNTLWEQHDPSVQRFAEIYSMWGASDLRDSPLAAAWLKPDQGVTVNDILRRGARLGFTGGGDCHEGHCGFSPEDPDRQGLIPHTFSAVICYRCGLTAALMPDLDRGHLLRAIRDRRTYATTGARILLDFSAAGLAMGEDGEATKVECRATVHAEAPLRALEIVKDGWVAWTQPGRGPDATLSWRDPEPPAKEHYYYLHVVQEDGQMAWSSPIWVRPPAGAGQAQ